MANKRKYPEVKGYWVYSIQIKSNGKYYIGVSKCKKCSQRWQKSRYKGTALEPYLDEWDSMIKTVLVDNLTKEQAYQYEDNIIRALQMNDLCINTNRSGLIRVSDTNAYQRELLKNNPEYREREKQYCKQRYENDVEFRERVKQQVKQWRKDNKEKWNEYQRQQQRQRRLKKKLEKQQTVVP
jgi:acetyl/propionyl-CoA carboxylase alpha subunit